jgi:hypothetical protein
MKTEEIIDGNVYFVCCPSLESEDFGDNRPPLPFEAVAQWEGSVDDKVLHMYALDEDGNPDFDSNTTCVPSLSQVFDDEKLAKEYYNQKATEYAKGLLKEASEVLNTLF